MASCASYSERIQPVCLGCDKSDEEDVAVVEGVERVCERSGHQGGGSKEQGGIKM